MDDIRWKQRLQHYSKALSLRVRPVGSPDAGHPGCCEMTEAFGLSEATLEKIRQVFFPEILDESVLDHIQRVGQVFFVKPDSDPGSLHG